MQVTPAPVTRLIDEFSRLPGIGPKTASRLTFYLLRHSPEQALALATALRELHEKVLFCSRCFNIAESDPCVVCSDENRDRSTICVVEEPLDVLAIERTRDYHGLYHVLHGAIAPAEGIGPEDLKIAELVERVRQSPEKIQEIIIATNPNLEGEATAMYIARQFQGWPGSLKITRLARGLPMGGDLEYADEITLSRALSGRSEI
uniref:Recombination protein RecR n=1 Tax=uncultured Chloroflexota bacterium TaxID=166587 RepID=H5SPC3_9CHLR|nr:recombination protein RecR [uncultured Chloroflexota bacterium]